MKKYISYTSLICGLSTAFIGQIYSQSKDLAHSLKSYEMQQVTSAGDLPEWLKFLAPILAGIIGKLIDLYSKKLDQKKETKKEILNKELWQKQK